jgi:hypothetical protein
MKRVRCPKCDNHITFDETKYEPGQSLVFECEVCHKQFGIRIGVSKLQQTRKDEKKYGLEEEEQKEALGSVLVVENVFHYKQIIPLYEGDNVFGRYVKGTAINAPIETVDPSVDTRHCVITVRKNKQGAYRFILRDDNSTTGTFYMSELLGPKETVNMEDGGIITIGATTMIFREKKEEEEE